MDQQSRSDECSFDSSGGAFPDGYCVWRVKFGEPPTQVSCHCREGYVCGDGPIGFIPKFEEQYVKSPCVLPRAQGQQSQQRRY
jgi:hypothetical protein